MAHEGYEEHKACSRDDATAKLSDICIDTVRDHY